MSRFGHVLLLSVLLGVAGLSFTISPGRAAEAQAQFLPPHADTGMDTNGNGLIDQLVVNATVNVTVAGTFVTEGTLHDPTFALLVSTSNVSDLAVGVHVLSLTFYGPAIARASVAGPFDADLVLRDAGTFGFLDADTHTTSAYLSTDFEAPPSFMAAHTDNGIDTDANGAFDFLVVNATVNITSASSFLLRGLLRRANTSLFLTTSNQTSLEAGIHVVSLHFAGPFINVSGVDGPYTVDLRLFESGSGLRFDTDSYTTASYSHLDFDGPPAAFAPPHSDFGLDTDSNGLFDYLVVNASLQVSDPGLFEIEGSLREANLSLLGVASNITSLATGPQIVPLWFAGAGINLSRVDGPYTVELTLRDLATSTIWDEDSHNTTAYSYVLFEGPPAVFAPPYTEFGLDTDGNGLFDHLIVNATLQVFKTGTYRVFASLQFTPLPVGFLVENRTTLPPGTHTMPLWFYGPVLGATTVEAIEVNLVLQDEGNATTLDFDIHPTGPHLPSDFEGPESHNASGATREPVIDGTLAPGEWADATAVNLTAVPGNQVPGRLLMKNNATMLFLAYDATGDTTEDADDAASVSFDTDNDGIATDGREDQFVQRGTADDQAHYVYVFPIWVPEDTPYDTNISRHQGLASASGFGPSDNSPADHRTYEFAIPLALLGVAAEDTVALSGGSQAAPALFDAATGAFDVWPGFSTGTFPLWAYADVLLTDLTPPSLSISTPLEGALLSTPEFQVRWTSNDGGTGIDRFEVQLDGRIVAVPPASARSHTLSDVSDGAHSVTVVARDLAGNAREARVGLVIDATPPALAVTSLLTRFWVSVDRVEVTWTAGDATSGIDRFEICLDGGPPVTLVSSARSRVFQGLGEGLHTVNITAFDAAGNRRLAVDVFAVDTVPPTIAVTEPVQDAILTSSFPKIRWTGDDERSGITLYEIRLDERAPLLAGESTNELTLAGVGDGRHVLVVTARDLAGNSASASVDFSVDTNIFSPTGPFGIFLLLNVVVAAVVASAIGVWLYARRRGRRSE